MLIAQTSDTGTSNVKFNPTTRVRLVAIFLATPSSEEYSSSALLLLLRVATIVSL